MYDGVLRLTVPAGTQIIGFADDVAIVVVGKELGETEDLCNLSIRRVQQWLSSVGLELAAHKTEAVLVSSRKRVETARIIVGSSTIESKRAIKYLGVMLDTRMSFREHMEYIHQKAADSTRSLARIMLNTRGPKQQRRRLLMSVSRAIILYAAPVWHSAVSTPSYCRGICSVYRLSAIRVICAFRTISDEAALVIAGMIPITELALESGTTHGAAEQRVSARQRSISRWQARWDNSPKGRWTYRLIPDLATWIGRKHGEVNFHLTQLLSGHGCFRSYLKRFGHDTTDECPSCGRHKVEDAHHVIFECRRFSGLRYTLEESVGSPITVANLVPLMLESSQKWSAVCTFASAVMTALRRAERSRRAE